MLKARLNSAAFAISILVIAGSVNAQTNLLKNPGADLSGNSWRAVGNATIEEINGNKIFVIRSEDNGKIYSFSQIVDLNSSDIGRYALFIGRGLSERVNSDNLATGLPYLYGYMLRSYSAKGARINSYLQGQNMLAKQSATDEWATMSGIFRVPDGTVAVQFMLCQASQKGLPPNGSPARFDNVGLYLFDTEQEALDFVKRYK